MKNKEQNFISAIVYSYNCEKNVKEFFSELNKLLKNNFNHYEIIFVDDKSTDNSTKIIKEIAKKENDAKVSIINMSAYQGLEMSMNAGMDLAIGDFVLEFNSTVIDYNVELIMDVYKKCLEGNDIVYATSDRRKRLTSKWFYYLFNKNTHNVNKLTNETFNIISRRAINRVKNINKTIPYRKAVYASCGLKRAEIKYKSNNKKLKSLTKEANYSRKNIAFDSIILFTDLGYKFAMTMSIFMMICLLISGIYTIVVFATNNAIEGWTTTMILLSFAFFGIFTILTIMIKYLSILIDLTFKKQNYLVESIEKIN